MPAIKTHVSSVDSPSTQRILCPDYFEIYSCRHLQMNTQQGIHLATGVSVLDADVLPVVRVEGVKEPG